MPGFALRNPYLIIVGALIITLLGATAFYQMPVDVFPDLKIPAAGGGHLLFRDAAGGNRERHHHALRAILHVG
jgi:hypothetical protein